MTAMADIHGTRTKTNAALEAMLDPENASNDKRVTRLIAAVGVAALLALVALVLWSIWRGEAVQRWKAEAGPVPFFAAMAVLPAIGLPITPFFLIAGATFGMRVGLLGSAVALVVNLLLCHWVAQSGLRPRVERLLARLGYTLPRLDDQRSHATRFALLVKLAPGLPAFAKNYVLGLAGVPLAIYLAVSLLVTGVYGAALVVLGDSALQHDTRRTVVAGAVIAVAALGVWLWRRKKSGETAQVLSDAR